MQQVRILDSIDEIPSERWDALAPSDDPVWNKAVFRASERARLADGFAYIVAYDGERPVSVLPVFWFSRWELDANMGRQSRSAVASFRKVAPGFFTAPTLFCGSVLGSGHWPGREALDATSVNRMLDAILELCRTHKLTWLFYKDYPQDRVTEMCVREKAGRFAIVPALPDTVLDLTCNDFEGYLANLKIKARRNARHKIRKFNATGMSVERTGEYRALIPQMMTLYEQVYAQAKFRFDHLNAKFFEALLDNPLADQELVLCRKGDTLVAFALCLFRGKTCINLRIGLDYQETNDSFAYFMIHYETIRAALARGCTSVSFSITTYEPKIELGCKLRRLFHAGTHRNALARPLIVSTLPAMMARFDAAKQFPNDVLAE